MQKYEIIPHTADMRIRALGSTRAGLLAAVLKGMFAAAMPRAVENGKACERPFHMKADDFSALLIDVLNEAIFLSDTNHEYYDDIRFDLITDKEAKGSFVGKSAGSFETQIKAATHHDLEVKKNNQGQWEATVTFDV